MGYITATYPGKIEFPTATEGQFESIIYGAPMSVTITYDTSKVPLTGVYEYLTNKGTDGNIELAISNIAFEAASDNSNTMGWPLIQFNRGKFSGISYFCNYTIQNVTYQFTVNGLYWEITNAATAQVMASGTISTQSS
jgi:hypothetical protein